MRVMTDHFIAVIDPDVAADRARRVAETVVRRLVDAGHLLDEPDERHGLGKPAHPPGPNAPSDIDPFLPNGMDVSIGPDAYGFAQGDPKASCPSCGTGIPENDIIDMFRGWRSREFDGRYRCESCGTGTHANDLAWQDVEPVFAELCFTFWNWPPDTSEVDEMVAEIADVTGHTIMARMGTL